MDTSKDFDLFKERLQQKFVPLKEHASVQQVERFDYIGPFKDGLAVALLRVPKEGSIDSARGYGYIDRKGETVVPFQYSGAKDFSEGMAVVAQFVEKAPEQAAVDSWVDKLLDVVLPDEESQAPRHLQFGFIDSKGNEVIPMQYDDAYSFSEGFAAVKKNGQFFLINAANEAVHQLECDLVPPPHVVEAGKIQLVHRGEVIEYSI